jgi:hypothetical protein
VTATQVRASSGSRAGLWVGVGALVLALVAVIVLSGRTPTGEPFDVRSAAPDGYRAIATLLRDRGAQVREVDLARILDGTGRRDVGEVLFVPLASLLTPEELAALREQTSAGATLVLGETPATDSSELLDDPGDQFFSMGWVDGRALADDPAQPRDPGVCDMAELDGLGPIDDAFAGAVPVAPEARSCYGDGSSAAFQSRRNGTGREIVLSSPYLWVNARLQPAKESGGQPLDNAVTALRLLGPAPDGASPGVRVTVVGGADVLAGLTSGSEDPISLLPVPVKLALAQFLVAVVIYVWWRGRRLGRPVTETMPVQIEGSELVAAVGDLLRRKGNADRAGATLRAATRRDLGMRLGVPPTAPLTALVNVVAERTGRDPAEVHTLLAVTPVADANELVRLARALHVLRQEVLDVPAAR